MSIIDLGVLNHRRTLISTDCLSQVRLESAEICVDLCESVVCIALCESVVPITDIEKRRNFSYE